MKLFFLVLSKEEVYLLPIGLFTIVWRALLRDMAKRDMQLPAGRGPLCR